MNKYDGNHRSRLEKIARETMIENGLLPDFSPQALAELKRIQGPASRDGAVLRDLRSLLWSSIDNDDSLDLDQLAVAETLPGGQVRVLVAVADVDALVKAGSAIDDHARHNTTSVYTAARIFPMLPEKLSTDFTSLNYAEDRISMVVEIVTKPDGSLQSSQIYRALVRNKAKLAYNSVAAWLDGEGEIPQAVRGVDGLAENLRIQDRVAQQLEHFRDVHGALSLKTIEAKPLFEDGQLLALQEEEENRAKEIIENFMIAANGVVARYLDEKKYPSIRRVVRTPKRWERIVELADQHGYQLPENPDSRALERFLTLQRKADPLRFPDLSLSVIKLLGAGEYVADMPGETPPGHFGLAVKDYTHSTAPNRRFTDLITQRLLKAALEGVPVPYSKDELDDLAQHCTEQEDAANKVERKVGKSAAALLLASRIGEKFEAIVTGASPKGTWVRLLKVPVEGKVVENFAHLDVGDRTRVELIGVNVEQGFIDFRKIS